VADLIRFGAFELNLEAAELHTNGRSLRLPEQQFQILYVLLLAAGGVVSREEIRKRLWPNNTVVEFDRSINTAMMKLRLALGDTGDKPIYIETLVRRGYRLIVPVQREEHKAAEPPDGEVRQDSLVGQKVSQYRVLGMLRGASMGLVYKGEDLKLDPPREQTVPSPVKEHPATAAGKEPWLIVGALATHCCIRRGAVTDIPGVPRAVLNRWRDCALSLYARPAGHACHFSRRQTGCFCLFGRTAPRHLYRPDRRRKTFATHPGC
jgi:DNA-binding winged helix-turn-helix (wHTH) protein